VRAGRFEQNAALGFQVGIIDIDLQQEPVELGFGQRIGAFLLERVLRGQYVERGCGRSWRSPPNVTWYSCIACRSADWVRGEARLISSAISSWVKIGPLTNRKERLPLSRLFEHLRAENVGGHQVGRELDAAGRDAEHGAERFDQLRLGKARHADEQRVAARQHRKQGLLDHAFLAEDHLGDGALDLRNVGQCLFGCRDHGLLVNRISAGFDASHGCLRAFWFVTLKQLILR
jgi:hypothetical protein